MPTEGEETAAQWAARWAAQGALFASGGLALSWVLRIFFPPKPRVLILVERSEDVEGE